ncbi:MAG: hypothetical protein Q9181_006420 [Wetmoreana brouardii]
MAHGNMEHGEGAPGSLHMVDQRKRCKGSSGHTPVFTAESASDKVFLNNVDGKRFDSSGSDRPNQRGNEDPIAVIGMAVKFPKGATCKETFWQMLMDRQSALSDVPKDRFNGDAFYSDNAFKPGSLNAKGAHFIQDNVAAFDAPFFSISPAEAECMDPQQRWLLETTYHALENGQWLSTRFRTSVHVGSFGHDYGIMLSRDLNSYAQYKATGTSLAMLANRISWFYDFTGPSIEIETACSSSLNAFDLACQCIRNGQSDMGVVAGSNIIFNPDSSAALADLGFLSPDSKCYNFDQRANGYARGEGTAVVIIKPLSLALQDNNTIRAVIRATGSNQDGRIPGVSQPSSTAQETLIRQTYLSAGLDMRFTDFFEAHGTGKPVGDPIEALGIHLVFKDRLRHYPLRIGAVKTNIGHLGGASGLAGLIKAILVVEKRIIPPNAWFEKPNESIDPIDRNLEFPVEAMPWPMDGLRRASVNSFGFGGSNCHVIVDDAWSYLRIHGIQGRHCIKSSQTDSEITRDTNKQLGVLRSSGHATEKTYQDCWCGLLKMKTASSVSVQPYATVTTIVHLKEHLNPGFTMFKKSVQNPGIAFVFTGQGAEWTGMGMELLRYKAFKESLEFSQASLTDLGCTWSLLEEMKTDETRSDLHNPAYSQPICKALQLALVALLRDWGVKPDCVIGHSSEGVFHRKLKVRVAYHSTAMRGLAKAYSSSISEISSGSSESSNPRMISSLTGTECSFHELRDPGHWVSNLVSPVQFSRALSQIKSSHPFTAKKAQIHLICEIGPHGTLRGPIMDVLKDINLSRHVGYASLLTKGLSAMNTVLEAAGVVYCTGGSIDVPRTSADFVSTACLHRLTNLRAYPFDHSKHYWNEGRINGTVLYRAAGFIITAIEAVRQIAPMGKKILQYHLRNVTYGKAAVVPHRGSMEVQITLRQSDEETRNFLKWCEFRVYLFEGLEAVEAGRGSVALDHGTADASSNDDNSKDHDPRIQDMGHSDTFANCQITVSSKQFYDTLRNSGIAFGPTFQSLKDIRYDGKGAAAAHVEPFPLAFKSSSALQANISHPGALDAMLQISRVIMTKGGRKAMATMVPAKIPRLQISADLYDCKDLAVAVSA